MENVTSDQNRFYAFYESTKLNILRMKLIENGLIDINGTDEVGETGETPLMVAARSGNVELVKLILKKGGNVNQKDKYGNGTLERAISLAISTGTPELVIAFLEHKPNMMNINQKGDSALMWALRCYEISEFDAKYWGRHRTVSCKKVLYSILEYLLNSGEQEHMSYYKLCEAIICDDVERVKLILSKVEDVNFSKLKVEIPLEFAVVSNNLDIAKVLLESGMSPDPDENLNRKSLLVICINSGHKKLEKVEMLELLLKYKAKLPEDILYMACTQKFWDCAVVLTKYSADVNWFHSSGETPFHIACQYADIETLKVMVEHGANLLLRNKIGKTVLHIAAQNLKSYAEHCDSFSYIAYLVISQGLLDANVKDAFGYTPLYMGKNCCTNFLLLLKMGADFNEITTVEYSPTHSNCKSVRCSVFDFLQRLQLLGYNIRQSRPIININPSLLLTCNQELELLRSSVISWTPRATLYNVLFMKRNEMARFSNNENLKNFFDECHKDFEIRYPKFGSMLNVQYRQGLKRRVLLDLGKTSLAELLGTRVPEDSGEQILEYLNNTELQSFGNTKWDSL